LRHAGRITAVPGNLFGILFGAALACSGSHALFVSLRRRRGTVRTEGTVLEQVTDMASPLLPSGQDGLGVSSFGPDYRPVVEFTTAGGRVVQFRARLQMNSGALALLGRRYQAGRRVDVRYRPENPEQALLDTALANWVIAGLVLAAGLSILAASALAS
jgi:Protein of unknown function (DUF3592)